MWVTRREIARLERELSHALRRATAAEDELAAERQRKDSLVIQLASRVLTKHGAYGLDEAPQVQPPPNPQKFVREPTEIDEAKREYYIQCYRAAGKSEEDAIKLWEAEMRGEPVTYEYEQEQ